MRTPLFVFSLLSGCVSAAATCSVSAAVIADKVYWGDEHVHSGWSGDAGLAGNVLPPEQAVRFARGEEVKTTTGAMARLERPLDWMALTDHSDGMGTINMVREGNPEFMLDANAKRWGEMMDGGQGGPRGHQCAGNTDTAEDFHEPQVDDLGLAEKRRHHGEVQRAG